MRNVFRVVFHRATLIILFMLIQLVLLVAIIWRFNNFLVFFYAFSTLVSAVVALEVINSRDNPAYKIAWLVPMLLVPLFGGLVYLVFSHSGLSNKEKLRMNRILTRVYEANGADDVPMQIEALSHTAATQSRYITKYAYCPPCRNTRTRYLTMGETAFEEMKQAFEAAERYIFLEYFIIQEGVMWNSVLEILERKAAQGVDVRVIYDDLGCMYTLPWRYDRKLEKMGIRCCIFNPFRPELSSRFNNRSHRKTAVVDGHTAFTGGINMADEYINAIVKHGHWKDTVIMVQGDAAWLMTAAFLAMWDYLRGKEMDFAPFRPHPLPVPEYQDCAGFVQPYSDSPLDGESVGENIYMNLLYKAKKYVYITTPYLITDNEMVTALCTAAKCGVDVRIITPHIADKWYVHAVTRHYYDQLLESGVRIFEYTPGFIHAKSFVADDKYGVVGTVNLDYRSLYLHFENGVWMYGTDSVREIYDDFLATQSLSEEITLQIAQAVPFLRKLGRSVLSVFAPLM